jgi:hypothetical protein
MVVMIVPTWRKEENDGIVREWGRRLRDKVLAELVRRQGKEGVDATTREAVGEYANYDGMSSFRFGQTVI